MQSFTSGNRHLTIYILPVIFLFTISFTGCNCHSSLSVDYYAESDGDSGDYDTGYDDEPDYPDPPDDGGYDQPDNGDYGIILIGYWNITLMPCNNAEIKTSLRKSAPSELKYYEIEESNMPDFSASNKMYKLHKNNFKPIKTNSLKKYDRIRAVYTNSKSEWSNIVTIQ
jgi:hypothetical protein